jgi:hypothetical protein
MVQNVMYIEELLPKGARQMFLRLALFEFSVTTRPHIPPVKEGRLPAACNFDLWF